MEETILNTSKIIKARHDRFDRFCNFMECRRPTPLVAVSRMSDDMFEQLNLAARLYLSKVLTHQSTLLSEEEILYRFQHQQDEIINVTPTGMILPKHYSILENNMLIREFYQAISSIGLDDIIRDWHIPMHIRVKYPIAREENVNRPRHAPEDLHFDSWSGYSTHGITCLIPIMGDITNNNVAFYKPLNSYEEAWLMPLESGGKIPNLADHYERVEFTPSFGDIQFVDTASLHATNREENCGVRISIDNILMPKLDIEGSHENIENPRKAEMLSHDFLRTIGTENLFIFPDGDHNRKDTKGGTIDPTTFHIKSFGLGE